MGDGRHQQAREGSQERRRHGLKSREFQNREGRGATGWGAGLEKLPSD